jgi:hypothetical protein
VCMCTALSAGVVASVSNISSAGLSPITKLHVTGHLPVLITDANTAICYYKKLCYSCLIVLFCC